MGEGVRTVPLSLKATVELVQFICKSQVIDGVGGFRFVICNLSELLPDRNRVVS